MTASYSDRYEPPAPTLEISIISPMNPLHRVQVQALVDTGADVTIIGHGIVERLALPFVGEVRVTGLHGESSEVTLWRATVETRAFRFDVPVVELGSEAIVGRDVLNRLFLQLDGPKRRFALPRYSSPSK